MRSLIIRLFILLGLLFPSLASAFTMTGLTTQVYDVAIDFSPSSNPNGVWSYGYENILGGGFTLYTTPGLLNSTAINYWGSGSTTPGVFHNPTNSTIIPGTYSFEPGQAGFHPGPNGQYSVFRFTVPISGIYQLNSSFVGRDSVGPTTTDVHVLQNSTILFNGVINGFGPSSATVFSTSLTLQAGNFIDFAVGYGGNGNYGYDTTGIQATLTLQSATSIQTQANQTIGAISFSPATVSWGGATTASATATSGLAVSFSSTTQNVCTVSGSTVTGISAGTCTIAANQTGNASYNAATQVTQSIAIATPTPTSKSTSTTSSAAVSLSQSILTFSSQNVGTVSPPQSITLTNKGSAILNISSIAASGDYAQTTTCTTTLTAGANCTISVTFTPTASGVRAGTVTITSNAATSPSTVNLSGTGNAGGNTSTSQVPLNLVAGWNLLGNSSAAPIDVATTFGSVTTISTVWKWNKATGKWAFYAPSMTPSALATYAQGKGYEVLTSIAPKDGFWVNASKAVALNGPVANGVTLVESDLQQGWNLVGSADNMTPSQLNQGLSSSLSAAGKTIVTAWAWDAPTMKWKFYAPSLETQGGTVLSDYITAKGYLPFSAALTVSDGLWLNVVAPVAGGTGTGVTPPGIPTAITGSAMAGAPTVTGMSLSSGAVLATVIITGANFSTTPVKNTVKFNGTKAVVTVATAKSLTVKVPSGATSGTVTVATQGGTATSADSFTVSPGTPKLSLSTTSLAFAQRVPSNTSSKVQTVTLKNIGTATYTDLNILFSVPSDFVKTTTCGKSLSIGASCTIGVAFSPTYYTVNGLASDRTESIPINTKGTLKVSLKGSVPPLPVPSVELYYVPVGLGFAPQTLGTSSAARTVTLTNTGKAPLNIYCIETPPVGGASSCYQQQLYGLNPPPFEYAQTNTCKLTNLSYPPTNSSAASSASSNFLAIANLDVGASCTISVIFTPALSGVRKGVLIVDTNAANVPKLRRYMNGVGVNQGQTVPAPIIGSMSPTIVSMSPTSGPVGTYVTILGSNFSATPANNTVYFNGTPATVTTATTTSLTIIVPSGATTGKVLVITAGGAVESAGSITVPVPTGYILQGGLTWMPVSKTRFISYADATTFCGGTINGQVGWRLPSKDELSSLYNSGALKGHGWYLDNTWSSTSHSVGYNYGYYLNLGDYSVLNITTAHFFVTCVR